MTGAKQEIRADAGAPGVITADAHMEAIDVQPGPRFFAQQMAVGGLHQLLQAEAAQAEMELTAQLPCAVVQLAGAAAQAIFSREDVRGVHLLKWAIPAAKLRRQTAIRVVL